MTIDGLVFDQGPWKEAVGPHWAQGYQLLWQTGLRSVKRCQELEKGQVGAAISIYSGVGLPGFASG